MVAATLQNPRVSASHLDSVRPPLTSTASGSWDWELPFSPRAVRIYIVRGSGALAAPHPFRSDPWCERDSDRGIAWRVLARPTITHLLRVVREQDVEDEIPCPRYLSGATGEAAARLHQDPEDPLHLRKLIFLNRDDDIRVWFLTNSG